MDETFDHKEYDDRINLLFATKKHVFIKMGLKQTQRFNISCFANRSDKNVMPW